MIRPGPTAILGLACCLAPALAMVRGPGAGAWLAAALLAWLLVTAVAAARMPRSEHLLLATQIRGTARLGSTVALEAELTNLHFQRLRIEGALLHHGQLAYQPEGVRLALGPGEVARFEVTLRPQLRGMVSLGQLRVCVRGRLGWLERVVDLPLEGELRVHPRPVPGRLIGSLIPLAPPSQRRPCAERETFRGLRPFLPGDDARDLSWSATARSGSPVVRTWEAPRAGPVVLLLDRGAGMSVGIDGLQSRLDLAVAMATGLTRALRRTGHAVTLASWSSGLDDWLPAGPRGTAAIERSLANLEAATAPWDPTEIATALAPRLPPDATVIVLTEPDGEPEALARSLAALRERATTWVVLVGDPQLDAEARKPVRDLQDAYRYCAALALRGQRRAAIARWRAAGATVSDVSGGAGRFHHPVLT